MRRFQVYEYFPVFPLNFCIFGLAFIKLNKHTQRDNLHMCVFLACVCVFFFENIIYYVGAFEFLLCGRGSCLHVYKKNIAYFCASAGRPQIY